ncbi:MAG: methylenetetrahydrofolate reductase [Methanomassiliicoccales archaeon]|nr:methylenetetrahydrofolate reductase [Methanomassiliicoccales archaeon]
MRVGSNLERVLESGRFAVTAEIGPPKSSNPEIIRHHARMLRPHGDAFNLTDNQAATVKMSSFASSLLCLQEGAEPVMQMTCRDRNRIALQSDLLGAAALGIKNVLCLSGDHQRFGNQKEAKNVYDIDSIQELQIFRTMRDEKTVWGGDKLEQAPNVFLGATENPFADPLEFRVMRLGKKITAGAEFIQTQAVFDIERFERWMSDVRERGLDRKAHILAGVVPLKSLGAAKYMKTKVPGMVIPDSTIERIRAVGDVKSEGVKMCVEKIEQIKSIKGVHGVHIMAIAWEEIVPEIVQKTGLYPRPNV